MGSALAHHIRHETDNPSDWGFQAGVGMGGRLVDVKDQTCEAANQAMVDIFEMHGFDPAICEDGFIRLRRCPILETARAYPEVVCALHDGVQSGIFAAHGCPGAAPHITPFAEPGACRVPAKGGPVMSTERAT